MEKILIQLSKYVLYILVLFLGILIFEITPIRISCRLIGADILILSIAQVILVVFYKKFIMWGKGLQELDEKRSSLVAVIFFYMFFGSIALALIIISYVVP